MSKKPQGIPQHLDSWSLYKKGLCDDCWGGCCTLPVEAKPSDIVRLELATAEEMEFDPAAVAHRLKKEKLIQAYNDKSEMFIIAQRAGRDCIFLHAQTRRCTVYEKRPDTCRNFPRVGPKANFCPYRPR